MVDVDKCGHANDYDQRIADCACYGDLSRNGMETIHLGKGYTSCQSADDHDRHVGIKRAIVIEPAR